MKEFTSKYKTIGGKIVCTFVCDNSPECEEWLDYLIAVANVTSGASVEGSCKVENRPTDKRTTSKGMDIPESPSEAETGGKWEGLDNLRKNVDELFYRVGNLERKLYD